MFSFSFNLKAFVYFFRVGILNMLFYSISSFSLTVPSELITIVLGLVFMFSYFEKWGSNASLGLIIFYTPILFFQFMKSSTAFSLVDFSNLFFCINCRFCILSLTGKFCFSEFRFYIWVIYPRFFWVSGNDHGFLIIDNIFSRSISSSYSSRTRFFMG